MAKIGDQVQWLGGSLLDDPAKRPLRRGTLLALYSDYGGIKMAEVEWKGPRGGRKLSHIQVSQMQAAAQ
jgi:hypothetical protein